MPLTFPRKVEGWEPIRRVVTFPGDSQGTSVPCEISSGALTDHFGAGQESQQECIRAFQANRAIIEQKASDWFDVQGQRGPVLLTTADF
jgi:Protein of unknown function (DUF1488)